VIEKKKAKKKLDLVRRPMPKQEPFERVRNFDEVAFGYTPKLAQSEASRCLDCKKPRCVAGCPVSIDIPGFIKHIIEGDFSAGVKRIKESNALPAVPTGFKIAVVGSGPAGLTVANDLALWGHEVVIYEALHDAGGVLTYGIPEFRLPKAIVKREVEYVKGLGVKLYTDYIIGKTKTVDKLFEEFDAVFIGAGAGLPWFMDMPGESLNGVYSANEYLTRCNLMKGYRFPEYDTPMKHPSNVAVFGGGNVAMDCARTALRLGADEAHIVYRRGRHELPAREEEVENAEEEGVIFDLLTNPVRLIGNEHGWLTEMECLRMELGEPDASGRRRPVPIEGSNFRVKIDAAVCSIGNSPNPLIPLTTPGLDVGRKGNIEADEANGRSSRVGVWAAGDVVTGAATVISAMGAARAAARDMHEYLLAGKPADKWNVTPEEPAPTS
jgi:glutamate synthase (NADPH/NADH) small chain